MSDIQSVRRSFEILKAVSSRAEGVSLTDVATRVQLPKSTVSRMLSTLTQLGAVERGSGRGAHTGLFRIGPELIALAAHVAYPRSLVAVARRHMQELAETTGETLTLCVPDGDFALYIDQINSPHAFQMQDWTNRAMPLNTVSDGKLYLAYRPAEAVEHYLQRPLQKLTQNTIVNPVALRKELREIRRKGYAWTNGECDADLVGVAAPIQDEDDHVVASVCVFGPEFRFPKEENAGSLIQQTLETARKISLRLTTLNRPALPASHEVVE